MQGLSTEPIGGGAEARTTRLRLSQAADRRTGPIHLQILDQRTRNGPRYLAGRSAFIGLKIG
jgi:hypothetical protein